MSDALRETLERTLRETLHAKHVDMLIEASGAAIGDDVGDRMHAFDDRYRDAQTRTLMDALMPPIAAALEQAIQQEREKVQQANADAEFAASQLGAACAALTEKDAQIREWETGAVAASTEIVKLRRHAENDRGLRISYRETLEAISAALKVDIERTTDRGAILEALAALQQQLQETRESFEAVVRAAGPFMPPVPESTE